MPQNRATATVAMPPDELFGWLSRVENWPQFLEGLESVEPAGFRRYRWSVTFAKHARTVDVVVSVDQQRHRITWRHLHGTAFDGALRVMPHGDARSEVELTVRVEPSGLYEGVVDVFATKGTAGWMAERNVHALQDLVSSGRIRTGHPA